MVKMSPLQPTDRNSPDQGWLYLRCQQRISVRRVLRDMDVTTRRSSGNDLAAMMLINQVRLESRQPPQIDLIGENDMKTVSRMILGLIAAALVSISLGCQPPKPPAPAPAPGETEDAGSDNTTGNTTTGSETPVGETPVGEAPAEEAPAEEAPAEEAPAEEAPAEEAPEEEAPAEEETP